jgi:hypothetical protein
LEKGVVENKGGEVKKANSGLIFGLAIGVPLLLILNTLIIIKFAKKRDNSAKEDKDASPSA